VTTSPPPHPGFGAWVRARVPPLRGGREGDGRGGQGAPLLSTSLLVLDEPLTGASADWYTERLLIITRTRDERGLPTIVTSQLLSELLEEPVPAAPPPILSRWLSGLHIQGELGAEDIRLKRAL
jgi:hypothetical protein